MVIGGEERERDLHSSVGNIHAVPKDTKGAFDIHGGFCSTRENQADVIFHLDNVSQPRGGKEKAENGS